jgi:acetyl esterase/lipase
MDIYRPANPVPGRSIPFVVLVHGGPVHPGIPVKPKDWKFYVDYGRLLASRGLGVVMINHRMHDWSDVMQSRKDIDDAISYIKKHAGEYQFADDKIALWFYSLGGKHLEYFSNKKDDAVKAAISFYGFLENSGNAIDSTGHVPAQLIVRCGKDSKALLEATDNYIKRAINANLPVELINYPGGLHAFDIFQSSRMTGILIEKAISFLLENLK